MARAIPLDVLRAGRVERFETVLIPIVRRHDLAETIHGELHVRVAALVEPILPIPTWQDPGHGKLGPPMGLTKVVAHLGETGEADDDLAAAA